MQSQKRAPSRMCRLLFGLDLFLFLFLQVRRLSYRLFILGDYSKSTFYRLQLGYAPAERQGTPTNTLPAIPNLGIARYL